MNVAAGRAVYKRAGTRNPFASFCEMLARDAKIRVEKEGAVEPNRRIEDFMRRYGYEENRVFRVLAVAVAILLVLRVLRVLAIPVAIGIILVVGWLLLTTSVLIPRYPDFPPTARW
jgi:hypothetical protein